MSTTAKRATNTDAHARWLRTRARDLRRIADDLARQAHAIDNAASDLPLVFGRAVADLAVDVLSTEGPMHYRALFDHVEARGVRVRGGDPLAAFLTNIARDPRVHSVSPARSGVYGLARG